ncbi:MAG: 4Fe-4S binding protein [Nitrospirae bacterium]|nr:4Fe-4S binding protein [Nitrospirota bacterium]
MSQNMMKIDLSKCVGCGTCAIACKIGNNTPQRLGGQTFNRADFITETTGYFPNTKWIALPVLCNHCDDPACVAACPVAPIADANCVGGKRKAMYKLTAANGGLVLHDDARCIGCRACQRQCPYSTANTEASKANYSVISYHSVEPFGYLTSNSQAITDCTASEAEVRDAVGMTDLAPAYRNKWTYTDICGVIQNDVRRKSIVDKCHLCVHRLNDTTLDVSERKPYCVLACPAGVREIVTSVPAGAKVLASKSYTNLRKVVLIDPPASGSSRPNVYYVGSFSNR